MDKKYKDRWKIYMRQAMAEAKERKSPNAKLFMIPLRVLTLIEAMFERVCEIDDRLSEVEDKGKIAQRVEVKTDSYKHMMDQVFKHIPKDVPCKVCGESIKANSTIFIMVEREVLKKEQSHSGELHASHQSPMPMQVSYCHYNCMPSR